MVKCFRCGFETKYTGVTKYVGIDRQIDVKLCPGCYKEFKEVWNKFMMQGYIREQSKTKEPVRNKPIKFDKMASNAGEILFECDTFDCQECGDYDKKLNYCTRVFYIEGVIEQETPRRDINEQMQIQ